MLCSFVDYYNKSDIVSIILFIHMHICTKFSFGITGVKYFQIENKYFVIVFQETYMYVYKLTYTHLCNHQLCIFYGSLYSWFYWARLNLWLVPVWIFLLLRKHHSSYSKGTTFLLFKVTFIFQNQWKSNGNLNRDLVLLAYLMRMMSLVHTHYRKIITCLVFALCVSINFTDECIKNISQYCNPKD